MIGGEQIEVSGKAVLAGKSDQRAGDRDRRRLRDDRLDARVEQADEHGVAAGVGRAPDADACRVDAGQRGREGDCRAQIVMLLLRNDAAAIVAVAVAEMAIVEDDHREAGGPEALREAGKALLLHRREAMAHDDRRRRRGRRGAR